MSVIRWSVSVTPEVTQPLEAGGHTEFTTLHEDIRRTLGGSGSVTWAETIQDSTWAAGVHTEEVAQSTTGNEVVTAACDLLFIKHSGFSDAAHTTANTTDLLHLDSTSNPSGTVTYAKLEAGECIVIPRPAGIFYIHSSANSVSVEWAELT